MRQVGPERIAGMHSWYVRLTAMDVRLDMQREGVWWEWLKRGWNEKDLALVVAHVKKGIRTGKRNPGALKFSNLIGQVDYFEEDLAEAKALLRVPAGCEGRAEVMRGTGRAEASPGERPVRTAGDVLKGQEALEALKRLKEGL